MPSRRPLQFPYATSALLQIVDGPINNAGNASEEIWTWVMPRDQVVRHNNEQSRERRDEGSGDRWQWLFAHVRPPIFSADDVSRHRERKHEIAISDKEKIPTVTLAINYLRMVINILIDNPQYLKASKIDEELILGNTRSAKDS